MPALPSIPAPVVIYGQAYSAEFTEDRAVVEPRLEQAAEEARSRPAEAGIQQDAAGWKVSMAHRGACLSQAGGQGKKTGHRRSGSRLVKAGRPLFFGAAEGGVVSPVTFEARKHDRTGE